MSLLTIVQQHCQIHALAVPTAVVGSTDTTVQQLLGILNELVDSMTDESQWQAFSYEALFNFIPQEDQGSIYTLADEGFQWIHNETFYDRTLKRPVYGPVTDQEWQAIKAIPNPGPWYKWRIRQDRLLINPIPTTPYSLVAFEYGSSYGVKSSGGVAKQYFTADDDIFVLPEKIIRKGLAFRWKQVKGLPYQVDEEQYYKLLNNALTRDGGKRQYRLDCNQPLSLSPGIFVPSGNWPLVP